MSDVKMLVRVIISMMLLCSMLNGQSLHRRQQAIIQRQQKQLDQQQETLEKQLFSEAIVSSTSQDQKQLPINHAILDSIFNVPIQAIKAVNELVRTLAAIRARLNPKSQTARLVENVEDVEVIE